MGGLLAVLEKDFQELENFLTFQPEPEITNVIGKHRNHNFLDRKTLEPPISKEGTFGTFSS